ncbi:hypothetical protein PIIN_08631 [Serendipita indica DSM 11827]|uniref:F-box domain-containing protein n=1 Tax=Serendipita indica (strain DSM 11827) TaxID=1109443 RepID=G4TTN7_SERID|nr:hypothetical protein PIIN_08631 [Serendipita indica DSM 11827]
MGFNSLPTEIFIHILKNDDSRLLNATARSRALMGVCRHWYNIITSIPEFWTSVHVLLDSMPLSRFSWTLFLLSEQLRRCKGALIDVTWQVRVGTYHPDEILKVFGTHAPFKQWRSISIIRHDGAPPSAASLASLGIFSSLEEICDLSQKIDWAIRYIETTLPSDAPLRSLQCNIPYSLIAGMPAFRVPDALHNILRKVKMLRLMNMPRGGTLWDDLPANITELLVERLADLKRLDLSHIESLFVQDAVTNPNLTSFTFPALTRLDIRPMNWPTRRRVVFPCLLELCLRGTQHDSIEYISAPMLEKLIFNSEGEWHKPELLEGILALPEYSLWPKKELELRLLVSAQVVGRFLERLPELEKLVLYMQGTSIDLVVIQQILTPSRKSSNGDGGTRLRSLRVYLERDQRDANAWTWEWCLSRNPGMKEGMKTTSMEYFWTRSSQPSSFKTSLPYWFRY